MLTDSLTIGLASFVAALVAAFTLRWSGMRSPVAWAAGVGWGFTVGLVALDRHAGWLAGFSGLMRPRSGDDWLPLAMLFAVVVTTLASYAEREWRPMIVAIGGLVAVAVTARLFAGHMAQQWPLAEKAFWLAVLSGTLAALWGVLAAARPEEQPLVRTALLVVVAIGTAIAITLSGSFTYGQMCGAVAAALLGSALANVGNTSGAAGTAGGVALSLGAVILMSSFYAKLSTLDAALLLAAAAVAGGRLPSFVMPLAGWQQAALRAAVCVAPLVVTLVRVASRISTDPY